MEDDRSSHSNNSFFKQKSFIGLHKRVQSKYKEMQTKIEKSKSIDSILTACDEENEMTPILPNDVQFLRSDGRERVIETKGSSESLFMEEVETKDAPFQDIATFDIERHAETQVSTENLLLKENEMKDAFSEDFYTFFTESNRPECKIIDNIHLQNDNQEDNSTSIKSSLDDDVSRTSFESLNEIEDDIREISPSYIQATPAKVSIRQRITTRINAVKEKRIEKAKLETIKKKKESRDKTEKLVLSNTTRQDSKPTKRYKVATATIALIEANIFHEELLENKQMFHSRVRLGLEKFKSKAVKRIASKVEFSELVNLGLYEDNFLEISLWDKDMPCGRTVIDLEKIQKEKTHRMNIKLVETPNTEILILLTVTGTAQNTFFELDDNIDTRKAIDASCSKTPWYKFKADYTDVGYLAVFVYGAIGLAGNECCCILELENNRLQTTTEYKTNDPNWMKMFGFVVTDVASILEITVHDEKKSENVGKISIPLLSIRNGEKKWFALKDCTQRERAKGNNPRILIEMSLSWNLLKATRRVLNPKEVKYLETAEKLDRHLFARNLNRAKVVVNWILDASKLLKTCFAWDNRVLNFISLLIWLVTCWFFKLWMLPLILLLPFIWYRPVNYHYINWNKVLTKVKILDESTSKEYELDLRSEKEEKTSFRQKLISLQDMVQSVQVFIGNVACFGESVKNLFNFTVPFISTLVIILILLISFIMYLIPVNYMFMAWGVNKFMRKILWKNREPNNEILDILSRVPHDETLLKCQELPLEETEEVII